jgi:hypothetical protein
MSTLYNRIRGKGTAVTPPDESANKDKLANATNAINYICNDDTLRKSVANIAISMNEKDLEEIKKKSSPDFITLVSTLNKKVAEGKANADAAETERKTNEAMPAYTAEELKRGREPNRLGAYPSAPPNIPPPAAPPASAPPAAPPAAAPPAAPPGGGGGRRRTKKSKYYNKRRRTKGRRTKRRRSNKRRN